MTMEKRSVDVDEEGEKNNHDDRSKRICPDVRFGKAFRNQLKSNDALNALKTFAEASNKNGNVVAEYVNEGGTAKDILKVLKKMKNVNDFETAAVVFQALCSVITESTKELLIIQNDVETACEELLCTHTATIQNMITGNSSVFKYRRLALLMLQAMTSLSVRLAEKILQVFSFPPTVIVHFVRPHTKIRATFVQFLVSVLAYESSRLISALVEKKGLLNTVFPGLRQDSYEVTKWVLNTLYSITQNASLSKTLKMRVFNTVTLQSLYKLYSWAGHNVNVESDAVDEKVEEIRLLTHQLLLALTTSSKLGVIFQRSSLQEGKGNLNQLVFTLLECIKSPWSDPLQTDLVSNILASCPDLIDRYFNMLEECLHPSATNDWLNTMKFVEQVINKGMGVTKVVKDGETALCIPYFPSNLSTMLRFEDDSGRVHGHPSVRHGLVSFLLRLVLRVSTLLHQYSSNVTERERLLRHIKKYFPRAEVMVEIWQLGLSITNEEKSDVTVLPTAEMYYGDLCDLLNAICKLDSSFLNSLRFIDDFDISSPSSITSPQPVFTFKMASVTHRIFTPKFGTEKFENLLHSILLCCSNENISSDSEELLTDVLATSGLFVGNEEEIPIWVYAISSAVSSSSSNLLPNILLKIFRIYEKKKEKFVERLRNLSSEYEPPVMDDGCSNHDVSCFCGWFLREFPDLSGSFREFELCCCSPTQRVVQFGPMVVAFLYTLKRYQTHYTTTQQVDYVQPLTTFSCHLLEGILHFQTTVQPLSDLLQEYSSPFLEPFVQYVDIFLHQRFDLLPSVRDSFNTQLVSNMFAVANLHSAAQQVCSYINESSSVTNRMLWRSIIFSIAQLDANGMLEETHVNFALNVWKLICEKVETDESVENFKIACLKDLLLNSYVTQNFVKLEKKKSKRGSELQSVIFCILEQCKLKHRIWERVTVEKLLYPIRQSWTSAITSLAKKKRRCVEINEKALQLLDVPVATISHLMDVTINNLHIRLFANDKTGELSSWGILYSLLLPHLQSDVDDSILLHYAEFTVNLLLGLDSLSVDADKLEESFAELLSQHGSISILMSDDTLYRLLRRETGNCKSALQIYSSNVISFEGVIKNAPNVLEKPHLLFSMLENALSKQIAIEEHTYRIIREKYLSASVVYYDWLLQPPEWLSSNVNAILRILPENEEDKCVMDILEKIQSNWNYLSLNEDTVKLVREVFRKCSKMEDFFSLLLTTLQQSFIEHSDDALQYCWMVEALNEALKSFQDCDFLLLLPESKLENMIMSFLRIGIQRKDGNLLGFFCLLCRKIFANTEETFEGKEDSKDVVKKKSSSFTFDLVTSHSAFMDIILKDGDPIKAHILELSFDILINANASLMSQKHIPILLGAYRASLSKSDNIIISGLWRYEEVGFRLCDYRPYVWGEAAISHYSIRTSVSVALLRHPSVNHVLDILDPQMVDTTFKHFPLHLPLKPPYVPNLDMADAYNLSFMLPLIAHILSPESRFSIQKFTRCGAFGLVLYSLASLQSDVRNVAYHCLHSFKSHLSLISKKDKEAFLWLSFVESLSEGVAAMMPPRTESDKSSPPPALSCIPAIFLARMSLILTEPLHPLFEPLQKYLLAKSAFNLTTVPEFLQLFHSSDGKHREKQEWILNVVNDGLRTRTDFQLVKNAFLPKMLFTYYFSSLSNKPINILILAILNKMVRVHPKYLLSECSLIPLLQQIASDVFAAADKNKVKGVDVALLAIMESLAERCPQVTSSPTFVWIYDNVRSHRSS